MLDPGLPFDDKDSLEQVVIAHKSVLEQPGKTFSLRRRQLEYGWDMPLVLQHYHQLDRLDNSPSSSYGHVAQKGTTATQPESSSMHTTRSCFCTSNCAYDRSKCEPCVCRCSENLDNSVYGSSGTLAVSRVCSQAHYVIDHTCPCGCGAEHPIMAPRF
jgi:hypothetical protein